MHVEYLAKSLAPLVDLTVHCQGIDRPDAVAHHPWGALNDQVLRVFSTDLSMAEAVAGADLVHSHTWYANLAGRLASLRYGIPHVVTMHSLEPLRPWKAEQLGGGYALSSWASGRPPPTRRRWWRSPKACGLTSWPLIQTFIRNVRVSYATASTRPSTGRTPAPTF